MSTPVEACCGLFDDSGLRWVLSGNSGLSPEFELRILRLRDALDKAEKLICGNEEALIKSPEMVEIRELAQLALKQLIDEVGTDPPPPV